MEPQGAAHTDGGTTPAGEAMTQGSGARALGWGPCFLGGGLAAALALLIDSSLDPRFGEGLALRSLRSLAQHPLRGGLGLALILRALAGSIYPSNTQQQPVKQRTDQHPSAIQKPPTSRRPQT